MIDSTRIPDFNEPIVAHARKDFPLLDVSATVEVALERIRREGVGERVIYFYAVDAEGRLAGVLPTRRLLTAPLDQRLEEIIVRRVVAVPATATVLDACEFFVLYKFFAFPVVDAERRVLGVVDVSLFADEILEASEHEPTGKPADDVFEALGFRISEVRGASSLRVFRYRFPWLLVTICTGTICAFLAQGFETTLASSLVVAFFLTMVLGLNESVSMQSMTLTIQALRVTTLSRRWFLSALAREAPVALLIGGGSGVLVALIVWAWRSDLLGAIAVGSSIVVSLLTAAFFGLTVPALLHWLKLDPKIAAGPVTLALTDTCALAFYFGIASLVLR